MLKKTDDLVREGVPKSDTQVIVYMLVSGGREPFWDGSDIRAIKNTLKKEVAINSPSLKFCTKEITLL